MKSKICILAVIASCVLFTSIAHAAPRAAESTGYSFLVAAEGLTGWHAGGYYRVHQFDIRAGGMDRELKFKRSAFFLARDVLPWMAAYAVVGRMSAGFNHANSNSDRSTEFGVGAWANLLDHDIIDNLSVESRIRVQAMTQYIVGRPKIDNYDFQYGEWHGSLTLSVINEIVGSKRYWPETVSLFAGPCFTRIDGKDFSTRTGAFGLMAGSDIQVSRRLSISGAYEAYEGGSHAITGSLNLRF